MMRNKSLGLIHLIVAVGTIFFCTLRGQVLYEQPEIIPYRFVPAFDNYCWVDVEIIEPVSIQNLVGIHKYETTEIIKERIELLVALYSGFHSTCNSSFTLCLKINQISWKFIDILE